MLQFDNVSYGIEPLGYSPAFEHLVYRVRDGTAAGSLLTSSRPEAGPDGLTAMEAPSRAQGRDEVSSEVLALLLLSPSHKGGLIPWEALLGAVWVDRDEGECLCRVLCGSLPI